MKNGERKNQSTKTTNQSNHDRRRALKQTLLGTGILATAHWSRPVVESVVLPAHATTTDSGGDESGGNTSASYFQNVSEQLFTFDRSNVSENQIIAASDNPVPENIVGRLSNLVVPPAQAQESVRETNIYACVTTSDGTTYNVDYTLVFSPSIFTSGSTTVYSGSGPLNTAIPLSRDPNDCGDIKGIEFSPTAIVSSPTESDVQLSVNILKFGGDVTVGAGACRSFTPSCPESIPQ
ncbi:MAG: hypothetical protein AAF402_03720 [Pseudomonadota bacterium]